MEGESQNAVPQAIPNTRHPHQQGPAHDSGRAPPPLGAQCRRPARIRHRRPGPGGPPEMRAADGRGSHGRFEPLRSAMKMSRAAYAGMFGPTTGDKVRLADTELVIEIEKDFTTYGEEVKFGGGTTIRDGMGQSQVTRAAGAVDTVITNVVILDHWGIVKADVGIKDGRI